MILQKEEIGYIFNPYVLLSGDILLMNTYEERLREKMECKYEHAAVYLGDAYLMEANGAYDVMTHIYSYAFRNIDDACVLRMKSISPITRDSVVRAARQKMGREYINTNQFRYVRVLKNTNKKDDTNRSFCSRLVAQAYACEGINLLPNADYCEPDDFLQSELLEEVVDALVPFTDEMTEVIMNNQVIREQEEAESPNAQLFASLSGLYDEDIQELTQALLVAQQQPEKSEQAIDLIKSSGMFKHNEEVKRKCPWVFDDDDFFEHFQDFDKGMRFLHSSMNHYDHTILPDYKQLHLQLVTIAHYCPDFKVGIFLRDYIGVMVEEAIECRKRFEDLYVEAFTRNEEVFLSFVEKYGVYNDYEYHDKPTDISFILREVMKAWEKKKASCDKIEDIN